MSILAPLSDSMIYTLVVVAYTSPGGSWTRLESLHVKSASLDALERRGLIEFGHRDNVRATEAGRQWLLEAGK